MRSRYLFDFYNRDTQIWYPEWYPEGSPGEKFAVPARLWFELWAPNRSPDPDVNTFRDVGEGACETREREGCVLLFLVLLFFFFWFFAVAVVAAASAIANMSPSAAVRHVSSASSWASPSTTCASQGSHLRLHVFLCLDLLHVVEFLLLLLLLRCVFFSAFCLFNCCLFFVAPLSSSSSSLSLFICVFLWLSLCIFLRSEIPVSWIRFQS